LLRVECGKLRKIWQILNRFFECFLLHIQVSAGDESRMAGDGDVLYGRSGGVSYGRRW
jgi:hypothetical protein